MRENWSLGFLTRVGFRNHNKVVLTIMSEILFFSLIYADVLPKCAAFN